MWMLARQMNDRPSKSVAFQLDDTGGRLSSGECELVGVSDAGKSFPSSSRPDDTDYGTSELESIARKRVDVVSGRRVHEATGMGVPYCSGTSVQQWFGYWAFKVLSERFCENSSKKVFC